VRYSGARYAPPALPFLSVPEAKWRDTDGPPVAWHVQCHGSSPAMSADELVVSFVDETPDVTRNYDGGLASVGSPPSHASIPFGAMRQVAIRSLISPSSSVASPPSDGGSRENSAVHSPIDEPAPREFESGAYQMDESPRDGNSSIGRRVETRRLPLSDILIPPPQRESPLTSPPPSRRRTYDDPMDEDDHEVQRIAWPLEDHRDAMLLRHFITHLGKLVGAVVPSPILGVG